MTIARTELVERIRELLLQRQVRVDKADLCASIIAESTADGVISHGIARLPRLLDQIDAGDIDPAAEPVKLDAPSAPAMEGYDGHRGHRHIKCGLRRGPGHGAGRRIRHRHGRPA
jgi:3-dehydro-L-gulonate 2-dehydrogenase